MEQKITAFSLLISVSLNDDDASLDSVISNADYSVKDEDNRIKKTELLGVQNDDGEIGLNIFLNQEMTENEIQEMVQELDYEIIEDDIDDCSITDIQMKLCL